jgi:uncharacterized protein (DUF58 family)
MTLAPGQNTTLTASFEPQKRGVLSLSGLAVQSYFPFFLSRHSQRLEDTAEVYVLPPGLKGAVPSLRHIAEQASKRMAQGSDNAGRGGGAGICLFTAILDRGFTPAPRPSRQQPAR